MINGLLAPRIIKGIFKVFLWLLIWIEVDLLSRFMIGIDLSPVALPLWGLHGIGRWVPWGSMVALVVWLLQLMLVASVLRKFGVVRWTPYNAREASYMLGEANGIRKAGPNWDLPGEELVTVSQNVHEMKFVLGPNDERMNSKDKIILEGLVNFFVTSANPLVVSAWGGMDALLSGNLRSIAIDILDRAAQKDDYEKVMNRAGSGKFGMKLKASMEALTPTEEERRHLAEFPGLEKFARRAETTMEIFGIRIPRVNAHLDENSAIAEAAGKAKEAEEAVKSAKAQANAEKARAEGIRDSVAKMLNITQKEFSELPHEDQLEAIRVFTGQSTSTTERKSFDVGTGGAKVIGDFAEMAVALIKGSSDDS